ncbi:MAG: hypothetical protein IJI36_09605 [Kiritimatiellae bacterium]|nr:hypothetical protein [Kiritimatiellia bacterium]
MKTAVCQGARQSANAPSFFCGATLPRQIGSSDEIGNSGVSVTSDLVSEAFLTVNRHSAALVSP